MKSNKNFKTIITVILCTTLICIFAVSTCAASGDVAGAVESTWNTAKVQIKQVVNNVVFPVIDLVLAISFFVKVALAYIDYRKHGQFEFAAPAILFGTLIFALTAPMYIWGIVGM